MACYRLRKAFLSLPDARGKTGRPNFPYDYPVGLPDERKLLLPCGKCIGCYLSVTQSWAIRCSHESSLYDDGLNNSFVTLTYSDDHLPIGNTLVKKDIQLFFKRLRKARSGIPIRYYYCGEYGSQTFRPHYHLILFNTSFPDQESWRVINDCRTFVSEELASIWGKGFVTTAPVTYESAAYTARYVAKKAIANDFIPSEIVLDSGEIIEIQPEYQNMSKMNGGIGYGWYSQYKHDIYNHGFVITPNGHKARIPAYYDKCYDREHPDLFLPIKEKRKSLALDLSNDADNDVSRMIVKEKTKLLQIQKYIRTL